MSRPRPPRILHVIGQLARGGTEGQLLAIVRAMDERGWRQGVVTFNPGDVWDERVTDMGLPLYGIPRSRVKAWRFWQLLAAVRRTRPTIVHSWSTFTNFYMGILPRSLGAQRIVSLREILSVSATRGTRIAGSPWFRRFGGFDFAVSNSQAALDAAVRLGLELPEAAVTGNLVEVPGDVRPRPMGRPMRIRAAGSLTPGKGYETLLRAAALLARRGGAFDVQIAGEGSERGRLERWAADHGIDSRVRFVGELDHVPAWLHSGDVFVHPSRTEGLSNSILEAQSQGLAVIATTVGGTAEIVRDGVSGLLVPPDDPGAVATGLQSLLDDPALAGRLQAGGLASVRRLCDPTVVADRYEAVYSRLAGRLPDLS